VGCGCRGRSLAGTLHERGHAVRGTSREPAALPELEAVGVEPALANPDRLGTLMPHLAGVSVICWLLGSATGPGAAELHGARLRSLLERLVDTPVRGFVYEAAGTLDPALLAAGAGAVRAAAATWRLPVEIVDAEPAAQPEWLAAMGAAVDRLLATGR
jgi:uncharacterized protein YbjT (DUF2867 family)